MARCPIVAAKPATAEIAEINSARLRQGVCSDYQLVISDEQTIDQIQDRYGRICARRRMQRLPPPRRDLRLAVSAVVFEQQSVSAWFTGLEPGFVSHADRLTLLLAGILQIEDRTWSASERSFFL